MSGLEGYLATVRALRTALTEVAVKEVGRELRRQRQDVTAPLEKAADLGVKDVLAIWDPAQLVPDWHAARLKRALANVYSRALHEGFDASLKGFNLRAKLTNDDVRGFLDQTGERITYVTETTRLAVRAALRDALLARETTRETAKRLRGLPEFNDERALLVAETEMANATNLAAMLAYQKDDRVVGVRIHDGEACAPTGPCTGQNGRVLDMAQAAQTPLLFHPRCGQVRSPLLVGAE